MNDFDCECIVCCLLETLNMYTGKLYKRLLQKGQIIIWNISNDPSNLWKYIPLCTYLSPDYYTTKKNV